LTRGRGVQRNTANKGLVSAWVTQHQDLKKKNKKKKTPRARIQSGAAPRPGTTRKTDGRK